MKQQESGRVHVAWFTLEAADIESILQPEWFTAAVRKNKSNIVK